MNLKDPKEAREIIKRTKEDDPDFSCYFLAKGFLDGWNQHAKAAEPLVQALEKVHSLEFADDGYFPVNTAMRIIENTLEKYKKEGLGE